MSADSTATPSFGSSGRRGHDASPFYDRFPPGVESDDCVVAAPTVLDRIWVGDARDMDSHGDVADGSVALVVTSPPYYAGKEYENADAAWETPATYGAYLELLRTVFAQCWRKLQPGGRIAVNVANLGRKPYRSLSAEVLGILDGLDGSILRGEVVWRKASATSGSYAWGSYCSPANPTLRDTTERIVVASKGRRGRVPSAAVRRACGAPATSDVSGDEFMEASSDVWHLRPASAQQVGHPAPFPVELPLRLIRQHTFVGELVLDPFMGSGATAAAAVRSGRHYVGFDVSADYVRLAESRLASESLDGGPLSVPRLTVRRAAVAVLRDAGFTRVSHRVNCRGGLVMALEAYDQAGRRWRFDTAGAFSLSGAAGLADAALARQCVGRALEYAHVGGVGLLGVFTPALPAARTRRRGWLDSLTGPDGPFAAIIDLSRTDAAARLGEAAAAV